MEVKLLTESEANGVKPNIVLLDKEVNLWSGRQKIAN